MEVQPVTAAAFYRDAFLVAVKASPCFPRLKLWCEVRAVENVWFALNLTQLLYILR